jgi:hypothetical protein
MSVGMLFTVFAFSGSIGFGVLFGIRAWGERNGVHSWILVKRLDIGWERFWRGVDFLNVNPSLLPSSTILTESGGTRCLSEIRKCFNANQSFLPGIDSLVEDICPSQRHD